MKNRRKGIIVLALCVLSGLLLLVVGCSQSRGKASWSKVGRYENKRIGFSIEYDAEKLSQSVPPAGPFIFMRRSSEQYPMMAISTGPYPQGTALKATSGLITGSFPMLIPGSRVHGVENQKMIKLSDQTEVNYFEVKWNDSSIDLATAFVVAQKDDLMITVSVSDKVKNSVEDLAAIVKTLKFDIKVDMEALKSVGFGKNGQFERTGSPAFTLQYPKNFRNLPLQGEQIFRAGVPQGSPSISLAILPLRSGGDIKEQLRVQAAGYANLLGAIGSDIKIISNKAIDNYHEFPASQFEIVWKYQGRISVSTVSHVIAKENQIIQLVGHTVYDTGELLDIFKAINLNP
ncbi:MAG: hypothetical protein HN945_03520 [Deltaproteobacteria bacterium]|nr:hypothetical protein [Deltaproteobacteria bacterium]MBT7712954.1 hypothetical protein [Deltaproteobacteria bacterium]